MRRFENDRFLGGGNRESHCLFMLMREVKGAKNFKNRKILWTFFYIHWKMDIEICEKNRIKERGLFLA